MLAQTYAILVHRARFALSSQSAPAVSADHLTVCTALLLSATSSFSFTSTLRYVLSHSLAVQSAVRRARVLPMSLHTSVSNPGDGGDMPYYTSAAPDIIAQNG